MDHLFWHTPTAPPIAVLLQNRHPEWGLPIPSPKTWTPNPWRGSLLPLGCEAAPKPEHPIRGEGACSRWAAKQPQNL